MWPLWALLAVQSAPIETSLPATMPADGQLVYADIAHDVAVRFYEWPDGVSVFSSVLPAGWTFQINVDGNQDGVWGSAVGMPIPSLRTSADHTFGQDSRNGVFCSQYILSTTQDEPSEIYASSECGELPSKGRVILSGFDHRMRANITYQIPSDEVFGDRRTAHVQVCVWNGKGITCQQALPGLLELQRKPNS
jgi:hypothetical protein